MSATAAARPAAALMATGAQAPGPTGEITSLLAPGGVPRSTLGFGAIAILTTLGWVIERRRRKLLEVEKDSVLWANVQSPGSSIITTAGGLDDQLPDSADPAEAQPDLHLAALGASNSRREATLIDLHQLQGKLQRRRDRGDPVAAVQLLQEHLADFRYTSPWVFLELLELYRVLDRPAEWDVARGVFSQRFGQEAPRWTDPSTEGAELLALPLLCDELSGFWPLREARMLVLRWMLGEPAMRHECCGPPLLGLGVYRDLMLLDAVLDEVMVARVKSVDSFL